VKCKFWDEDCIHLEPCEVAPAKFWTPAERAGIKAMGGGIWLGRHCANQPLEMAVASTIRAYVAASRRAKEEGR